MQFWLDFASLGLCRCRLGHLVLQISILNKHFHFRLKGWMPKLLWQHLHTRGWALVHDQAAHCWKVQLSQVSGRQLHGEGGSCPAAAVGCPGLAQCLSPLGPPAGPSLLVWHQLTPATAILITGDRKQSEKGNHILSWKPNSLPKVSSSEVSIALLWPNSYKNIRACAGRADCRVDNTVNVWL